MNSSENQDLLTFNPKHCPGKTSTKVTHYKKLKADSKKYGSLIGWNVYIKNAVESKAFGNTLKEVMEADCETVLEYFSIENGTVV